MRRNPLDFGVIGVVAGVALALGGCDFLRQHFAPRHLSIKDSPADGGASATSPRRTSVRAADASVGKRASIAKVEPEPSTSNRAVAGVSTGSSSPEKDQQFGFKPTEVAKVPPPAANAPTPSAPAGAAVALAAPSPAEPSPPPPASRAPMPPEQTKSAPPKPVDPAKIEQSIRTVSLHLLDEGRRLFTLGRVIDARARLYAGIDSSTPEVMTMLARTFDPFYLKQLDSSDASPNVERAISLYERAAEQGSEDAAKDLERIKSVQAPTPRH